MWSKNSSVLLSKGLIILGFILAAIIIPFIPQCAKWYDSISGEDPVWIPLSIVFYVTIGIVIFLLITLFRLLNNISKKITFVDQNTKFLRCISWCCFLISAIYFIFGIIAQPALLIAFITGFMGLIIRILKNVFAQAVTIREENDYTV